MNLLKLFKKKIKIESNTSAQMNKEQIIQALAMDEQAPLWRALEQVFDDHLNDAVNLISSPTIAERHGMLAHQAGEIEGLVKLREHLRELRAAGAGRMRK